MLRCAFPREMNSITWETPRRADSHSENLSVLIKITRRHAGNRSPTTLCKPKTNAQHTRNNCFLRFVRSLPTLRFLLAGRACCGNRSHKVRFTIFPPTAAHRIAFPAVSYRETRLTTLVFHPPRLQSPSNGTALKSY